MAFVLQMLGFLAFIGFLWFVWPPLALGAAGVFVFLIGWALDRAPAPKPKDE